MNRVIAALVLSITTYSVIGNSALLPPGGINWINCTKPNEMYDCGSACQTECKTLNETCPIINVRCNDDCYCIPGYARDENGVCIPIEKCPAKPPKPNPCWINCTKPNEMYACGSACQTECKTLNETCPIINVRCNDACYCIPGYARDEKGVCIPIEKCPPKPPKHHCKRHGHGEKSDEDGY